MARKIGERDEPAHDEHLAIDEGEDRADRDRSEEGAGAPDGVEPPVGVARRLDAEREAGHRREQPDVDEAEQREQEHPEQQSAEHEPLPNGVQPDPELAPALGGVDALHVGHPHVQQGGDEEQVRERVDDEDAGHRHPAGEEQRGEYRTDDASAVHHRRVEADRPRQVLTVHEQRHRRLERGCVERVGDADEQLRGEERPQRGVGRHAIRDDQREECRRALHRELQLLFRHSVGEHATGDREQQERSELHEHHQTDECRPARAVVDVRRQREVLHPRADVRQGQAEEDDPEPAVRECRPSGAGLVAVRRGREDFGGGAHRCAVGWRWAILTRRSSYRYRPRGSDIGWCAVPDDVAARRTNSAEQASEGSEVVDEQFRNLEGREVSALGLLATSGGCR